MCRIRKPLQWCFGAYGVVKMKKSGTIKRRSNNFSSWHAWRAIWLAEQLHAKHSAAAANSSTDNFSSTIGVSWWTKPANREIKCNVDRTSLSQLPYLSYNHIIFITQRVVITAIQEQVFIVLFFNVKSPLFRTNIELSKMCYLWLHYTSNVVYKPQYTNMNSI